MGRNRFLFTFNKGEKKMFCPKCGKEINNDAVVCVNCGCSVKKEPEKSQEYDEPKTGIGVLLGLFLGVIGLIIGICIYPEGTVARKTFIKAWGITFGVTAAVVVILIPIIYYVAMVAITYI